MHDDGSTRSAGHDGLDRSPPSAFSDRDPDATVVDRRRFDVSPSMTVLWGEGCFPAGIERLHSIVMVFALGGERDPSLVSIGPRVDVGTADVILLVDPEGCRAALGDAPVFEGTWHLSTDQRRIVRAILDCGLLEPAATTVRTIKSIELLWTVTVDLRAERLVPADEAHALMEDETRRLLAARQLIDEGWHRKLTLNAIARASGINRVKLTQGFRAMFGCTVAEAIAERRLSGARALLMSTDLPVSSIGYRCGYTNNASFTRAFSRRFGEAPTRLRAGSGGGV